MGVFAGAIVGGVVGVPPAKADGANERIINFINLAKNKATDNGTKIDITNMKEADAQFLGVFMSNFYVPYTTEIGYADSNDGGAEKAKTQMKGLLGKLGIADTKNQIALTEYVFEKSRDTTIKDMKWYFSKFPPASVSPETMVESKQTKNTVYNLHKMVSGMYMLGYDKYEHCNGKTDRGKINECYKAVFDSKNPKSAGTMTLGAGSDPDLIINEHMQYAYLASPDKSVVAFSTDLSLNTTTPSAIALANAAKLVDPNKGYGTSLFDFSEEDVKNNALASDNLLRSSIFDTPVGMDTFGNLISMGPNHQYIMMPGAMNPYTWQAVTAEGATAETKKGSVLNLMNLPMLSYSANGEVVHDCAVDLTTCGIHTQPAQDVRDKALKKITNKNDYPDDDGADDHKVGSSAPVARILRGSSDFELLNVENSFLGFGNKSDDKGKALKTVITDFVKANKENETSVVINWDKSSNNWDADAEYNQSVGWVYLPYFGNANYSLPEEKYMRVFTKGAAFDINGQFGGTDDSAADAMTKSPALPVIDQSGKTTDTGKAYSGSKSADFLNKFASTTNSGELVAADLSDAEMQTLYYTYLMAMDWGDTSEAAKQMNGALGYRINASNLPKIGDGNFEFSDEALAAMKDAGVNQRDEDIRNWVWYLLNPSEGFEYVTSLVTNKSTAFFMSTHANIVGATNAPAVAGSTKYLGFSGYVTVPELTDLPWTDAGLKWYNANWMYIALVMIIILGFYALTGVITIQRAIGGAILFAILAMVPANLINYTVNTSNRVTNAIYGEKFTYWALLQNQSYAAEIEKAAGEANYNDYLRRQMAANANLNITGIQGDSGQSSQGQNSVVVKWQAPKKMVTLMAGADQQLMGTASQETGSQLMAQGFAGLSTSYSGEAYLANDSVYMYRSYIDLSNFSRFIYRGYEEGKQKTATSIDTSKWPSSLKKAWSNRNTFSKSIKTGYNVANNESTSVEDSYRITKPLSSKIVADTFSQAGAIEKMTQKTYIGIDTRAFNFSIKPFNDGSSLSKGIAETTESLAAGKAQSADGSNYGDFDTKMKKGYTDKDYAGLAAYGIMSESPFYYFSWNLYDQGLSTKVGDSEGYKDLLLGDDGRSYFYNTKGNGEMKDFTDMRSLFTYTIPYMKAGNNVVRQFDNVFGLKYEAGVPTIEGYEDNSEIKNNPEMRQKYWKNLNISRLYSIYSPWVDLMYDTSYSEPETVMFQGQKLTIEDPIDPSSYPKSRPMVFSKSEQNDWGLKDDQLTQIELKIQKVQSNAQKKMFGLLNAYNYDDNVLVTAAAMNTTFEFNKEFSEANPFGDNVQLYPQSYELKNFSYDAFLRLILSNTTGDAISGQSATDFYTSVVQKSSMFTAGVMLLNDVVSVYLLPAAKVFGLIAVFITTILMIVASCIRIEENLVKNLLNSLAMPLLSLLGIFVGMAFVVSLFMSNGNTAVTGYDGVSISLGDPVMVLVAMLGLNCLVLMLLFKLFRYMIGNVIKYGRSIGTSMMSVVKGSGSAVKAISTGQGMRAAHSAAGVAAGVGAGVMAKGGSSTEYDRGDGRVSGTAMDRLAKNGSGGAFGVGARNTEGIRRPSTEDPKPKARVFNDNAVSDTATEDSSRFAQVRNEGQSRVHAASSHGERDPFLEEGSRRENEAQNESASRFDEELGGRDTEEDTERRDSTTPDEEVTSGGRKKFSFDGF